MSPVINRCTDPQQHEIYSLIVNDFHHQSIIQQVLLNGRSSVIKSRWRLHIMTQEPCFCLTIIPLFRSVVKGSVIHAIFLYYSEEITCKFHKKQRSVIKDANAKRPIHPCHTAAILSRETKKLCFTTLSLAMETMGIRLSVVKQSFFGPLGQYGRRVTRANSGHFDWTNK